MQDKATPCEFYRPTKGGKVQAHRMDAGKIKESEDALQIKEIAKNVPRIELARHRLVCALFECDPTLSDDQIAYQVAFTRATSPACHTCYAKGDSVKLQRCSRCRLVWYCSRSCQTTDWTAGRHKQWCCKGDAARPQASTVHDPVVAKMSNASLEMPDKPRVWGIDDVVEARRGDLWMPESTCSACDPMRPGAKKQCESRLCPKCLYTRFCRSCEPKCYDGHVQVCDGGYLRGIGDACLPK
ncbi:zf-MYND domain-containing protain [Acanthamoeba castellanii medusavirus]|uniref:Zf-MYND domain-containing protain n=1 Tax=Acanthamoeba castellanii medusavirus J1 TaxID=3114988 RepID=A0A3T1CXV6_9VIRU|nr:zf-MYND domain-containing protain [Acanthamoeba castellanii medusavirus]BBI30595.1 zf-MYND domain-containing protain [Acanthamoeba castellanii medusavirus J1]